MWARNYSNCTECHTTKRKHYGGGLCCRCYNRRSYQNNPEPARKRHLNYYSRNPDKCRKASIDYYRKHLPTRLRYQRTYRERKWYGGLREACLQRDNFKCTRCGKRAVVVHHADGKGRGHPKPNNTLSNLESMCRACHVRHHKPRKKTKAQTQRKLMNN